MIKLILIFTLFSSFANSQSNSRVEFQPFELLTIIAVTPESFDADFKKDSYFYMLSDHEIKIIKKLLSKNQKITRCNVDVRGRIDIYSNNRLCQIYYSSEGIFYDKTNNIHFINSRLFELMRFHYEYLKVNTNLVRRG
jgi:hypothetical protein